MREEILDRGRNALQRARARADREGRIGGIGAFPRMIRRPLRIGHELGAETLVIGDRLLGESARFELALAKRSRDLGHREGERVGHVRLPYGLNELRDPQLLGQLIEPARQGRVRSGCRRVTRAMRVSSLRSPGTVIRSTPGMRAPLRKSRTRVSTGGFEGIDFAERRDIDGCRSPVRYW